jgi:hypothetical protein
MYNEFIELTTYGEEYITANDYCTYIEPVYANSSEDRKVYCKRFYKNHRKYVSAAVNIMISSKSTQELEAFICGEKEIMTDVEALNLMLKIAFLKAWLKWNGNIERRSR